MVVCSICCTTTTHSLSYYYTGNELLLHTHSSTLVYYYTLTTIYYYTLIQLQSTTTHSLQSTCIAFLYISLCTGAIVCHLEGDCSVVFSKNMLSLTVPESCWNIVYSIDTRACVCTYSVHSKARHVTAHKECVVCLNAAASTCSFITTT